MAWNSLWPVVDGHADTLTALENQQRNFWEESPRGQLDLPRLGRAGIDLQVLAVCAERRLSPKNWARNLIGLFVEEVAANSGKVLLLREKDDWARWRLTGIPGLLIALEGLEALEGEPGALEEFYRQGVRMASLTWNHGNAFAGGALEHGGLTSAGREVIRRMEGLGMVLDLSHLNAESFWQVIREEPRCPVLASHSNAAALLRHPRNLDDEQIRAVSDLGGTVGVALYPPFLTGAAASVADAVRHLEHIGAIGGDDCPALGCDFDGVGQTLDDLADVSKLPALFAALGGSERGSSNLGRILGGNLYRVLRRTGG